MRSMDISSHELLELNEKLESAQRIARLGYWRYDREDDLLYWSKEMYQLTGFDSSVAAPSLNELIKQMHETYRPQFSGLLEQAFSGGTEFSMERSRRYRSCS